MRTLTAFDIVDAARMGVYRVLPYFMKMLYKLALVERVGIGTFYVDDRMRVHFDADVVKKWGIKACTTVLAHEVQHPIRDHHRRGMAWVDANAERWSELRPWLTKLHPMLGMKGPAFFWNILADIEINPTITACGLEWPEGFKPLFPSTFRIMNDDLSAEEYGRELFKRAESLQQNEVTMRPPQPGAQPTEDDDEAEADEHDGDGDASGSEGGLDGDPDDGGAVEDPADADAEDADAEAAPGDGQAAGGGDAGEPEDGEGEGHAVGGCCGSCAGHKHSTEDDADEADMPEGVSESQVEVARRQVAHDVLEPSDEMKRLMEQFGRGTVPGTLKGWAEAQLRPTEVPWQRVLAALTRNAVAVARGRVDWSRRRPNRRQSAYDAQFKNGTILPSLAWPVPNVGVVVDTSGSMQAKYREQRTHLDEALSEVGGIVLAVGLPVWCAAVDAGVQAWVRVKHRDDLKQLIAGGGGTDMRVGIAAAIERKFEVIVLVTDGYTPWPSITEMPRHANLVVCCTTDAEVPKHIKHVVRVALGKKGVA